jgi:putative DNA primase/helicase
MTLDHKERLKKATNWYAQQGWKILPCYGINDSGRCTCNGQHDEPKDVGKHPAIGDWNTRATNEEMVVQTWWNNSPEHNIGVVCQKSGFFVIDIDPRSGGIDSWDKFQELMEYDLPETVEAYTGAYSYNGKNSRGRHIYYKVDENEKLIGNLKSLNLPGIDIKHNGYVLLAPSRHFSGVNYEWVEGKAPWQIPIADASEKLLSVLRKSGRRNTGTSLGDSDWASFTGLEYRGESVDIAKFLEDGIDEGSRAVDIYKLACALANKMGVDTEYKRMAIETLMIRFNHEKVRPPMELEGPNSLLMHTRRAMDFVAENPVSERIWPGLQDWAEQNRAQNGVSYQGQTERVSTSDPDDIEIYQSTDLHGTVGGAVDEAARNGISIAQAFGSGDIDIPKDPDAITEAEGGTPGKRSLSDLGNGRRIVDSFGSSVRYTPGIGWFIWNGQYWRADAENLGMQELAKKLAPIIASEVAQYDDPDKKNDVVKWANQAKANGRLNGAIESANSDPRIVTAVEQWDGDKHLIGVANGVVDLKTGELLKGRPELHITKRAPVGYTQGLRNVRWEQFIDFATGGDKELQEWLQRAAGYTLTGLNTQDVMFLVYGPPGSGKNTFVEALVKALGTQQYSWPLDSSILAANDGSSSSTDLYHWAELRGRRMVWVDELPDSERLKENSVKKLTGSSEISARSPGEKPFTFESSAKLWVTTNHRPIITDEAMWRRLRPIPWSNVPDNPDPDLKAYLFDPEGALPAVLSWAVEGAIKYLNSSARDPLGWCTAVRTAGEMYQRNEDRIGMFLEEETKESAGGGLAVKSLYSVYRMWSEDRGEKAMTQIAFQRKLSDRGLDIVGQGSRAEIQNMMLIPKAVPTTTDVDWNVINRFNRF